MRLHLRADFKKGVGIATPWLILFWLALGLGLIWLQWYMSMAGIQSFSGNVKTVTVVTDPQSGTYVTIDSSSMNFFFNADGFAPPPDIRVGDHIDMLTLPWSEVFQRMDVVAVQSQRGTSVFGTLADLIGPFTPRTWAIHELLRWSSLVVGILALLLGAASLVRWFSASAPKVAPASATQSAPGPAVEGQLTSRPDATTPPEIWIGGVAVIALPLFEVVGVVSALGSCKGVASVDVLLIAITIALAAAGTTTLVLASRRDAASRDRSLARKLGVVAIVMAVASTPINLFVVLLSGFCAVG